MENIHERQENEITVLKSIFCNNIVDLRDLIQNHKELNNQNKKTNNFNLNNDLPILRITLYPQNSQSMDNRGVYVQIDLKVKLTSNYPNELPKITLENEKGLSLDQIKQLHRQLIKRANELIGFEMIYELCQHVQEFLYENNKPPTKSFYEQRLEWQKADMEKEEMEKNCFGGESFKMNDQLDLRAEIDQAVDMKIKMLNEERKKEKEAEKRERLLSNSSKDTNNNTNKSPLRARSSSSKKNSESDAKEISNDLVKQTLITASTKHITNIISDFKNSNQNTSSLSDASSVLMNNFQAANALFRPFEIEFFEPQPYKINCIKLINHIPEQCFSVYRGIEIRTQQIYTIYEWKLNLEKNKIFEKKKLETCHNEMHKLEEEFKRLTKLNNSLLVKYVAYKYYKEANKNIFVIQMCLEYVEGNSLDFFLKKQKSFAILDSTLQTYAIQLLDALDILHSNHLYHRDLKPSSVYIEKNGSNLKLSDYCLVKKVNNLNEVVTNEAINLVQGNLKSDMHQLGLLMLSLRLGENVKDYHPVVPTSVPPELRSFISICLRQDKVDCKYLRKHPFILQNIVDPENSKHIPYTRRAAISIHYDDDDQDDLTKFNDYPSQSRLNTEFEVIGVIGQGGFGEVLKVKNKLDSRFYAIKRIRINPNSKQNKQITREIKLLSRLNHENVVRYYSTWVESYEELINVNEKRRSTSQDTNTLSNRNFTKLIRFKSVENDHDSSTSLSGSDHDDDDEEDDEDDEDHYEDNQNEISSSSTSDGGCITWSRRESSKSASNKNESFSDSASNFSSSPSNHSVSSVHKNSEDYDDHEDITNLKKKNNINRRIRTTSTTKYVDENTDESVIFAENSDEQLKNEKNKIKDEDLDKLASAKTRYNNHHQVTFSSSSSSKQSNKKIRKKSLTLEPPDLPLLPPQRVNRQYLYIQMEYCGGKTLKDLIDNGLYQNEDRVWSLFREILQGLNHIHEQGMIHRDLKPGNVLIDTSGQHAKIGDFGLATTKLLIHKDNSNTSNQLSSINPAMGGSHLQVVHSTGNSNNNFSSNQNDSTSLSGAVGTALYVAPELLTPAVKNKYNYNQKVDIYSLGIMFYEMCFPFSTNMERIHVIQNLRQKEIIINENQLHNEKYKIQISLIKSMLNHDPSQRPTAKDLLINESIPRKADEIAFDELLKYSFNNKQSTNYKKIFDAIFKQKSTKIDDASFDPTNNKTPNSFRLLQLREHVYNTFLRVFQRHGAYMINNSLLIPYNSFLNEYKKTFKLTDAHGLVVCLPYNNRVPFARYLARSGCTNLKRYHIGKVYSEKLTSNSLHPREHMEASFDIITSSNTDCLPEIELLTVLNDIISSFSDLNEQSFKLILNHSFILNSILTYCGITEIHHKEIYAILSDYNSKLIKSLDVSKENRIKWFKEHLPVDIDRSKIETLLGLLLKYAEANEYDKFFSDLRNLTKTEKNSSKLAKEGLTQLKQIVNLYQSVGLKIPIVLSTSFVLPLISHPNEYSGLMFALLVQKKKKKEEYDILASGGRYDKLIAQFRTFQTQTQCAVGVSFDFDSIISLIYEKSKQAWFRNEIAICSIGDSLTNLLNNSNTINNSGGNSPPAISTNINLNSVTSSSNLTSLAKGRPSTNKLTKINNCNSNENSQINFHSLSLNEIKNRLRLFRQIDTLNKLFNVSTHILHQKFATEDEADEYCKKYCINSYAYFKDSSIDYTSQIFSQTYYSNGNTNIQNFSANNSSISIRNELMNMENPNNQSNTLISSSPSNNSSLSGSLISSSTLKFKSILDKGVKLFEKKINLSEFLMNSNQLINNMTSFNSINFVNYGMLLPFTNNSSLNVLSGASSSSTTVNSSSSSSTTMNNNSSYYDLFNSTISTYNSFTSSASFTHPSPATSSNSNLATSSSSLNSMSQLNITILVETGTRQTGGSNRKKLESQIIPKVSHIFSLFSSRTRIELIAIDVPDNVIQVLANGLHLEMDLEYFDSNWRQCLDKLNNTKYKKQLMNFRFDEIIKDLRYVRKSKVFIIYTLKSHQFKLLVAP